MKLTGLLIITCCSITLQPIESTKSQQETLEERASAQLKRLSLYQRIHDEEGLTALLQSISHSSGLQLVSMPRSNKFETDETYDEQRFALEFFKLLPQDVQQHIIATKRIDSSIEDRLINDVLTDPRKTLMMQERIKRSGSGSFVSNLAGGIVGGIASASASASKGSSTPQQPQGYATEYGPPVYAYDQKTFDIWDFKKAILNTLFQAIKAISGGVLALKGQIIKGSGYLISAKGRIISTTGDAITSLGRQIASSAVLSPPKLEYHNNGYTYEPPTISHDDSYSGHSPGNGYSGTDGYAEHSSYTAPSDVGDQAGLLIVKPTYAELESRDHFPSELNTQQQATTLTDLEDSFGGTTKEESSKDLTANLSSDYSFPTSNPIGKPPPCTVYKDYAHSHFSFEHSGSTYGAPNNYDDYTMKSNKDAQVYHSLPEKVHEITKDSYQSHSPDTSENSYNSKSQLLIRQSIQYPPTSLQPMPYLSSQKELSLNHLDLTKNKPSNNLSGLPWYLNGNTIKLPILNPENFSNALNYHPPLNDATSYGTTSPNDQSSYNGHQVEFNLPKSLRTSILHPLPERYWQTYSINGLQKKNGNNRRRFINVKRSLTQYQTSFHRL